MVFKGISFASLSVPFFMSQAHAQGLPAEGRQALALSWQNLVISVIYGFVGILLLIAGYYLYELITPFSVKKELIEDQNIAIGVVVAAMILGMAIIIAAAII